MLRCVSIASVVRNALVRRTYGLLLLTAAVVVAIDQATKHIALNTLADRPVDLIEGALSLRLTYNPGGAFGIFQGLPGLFLLAGVVVAVVILAWARHLTRARELIPLGLVLGGGLGNLADRVVRDTQGRVIDFIDLHVWPVFNVADSAIVIGVALLLLTGARSREPSTDR